MARKLVAAVILAISLASPLCSHAAPTAPAAPVSRQPNWAELTLDQKRVLAPLAQSWDTMPPIQRKRLLGVAKRYPKLTPQEQQRIQSRLTEWAKLTPAEREMARKRYQQLKQLPPEKRRELKRRWQEEARRKQQAQAVAAPPAKPAPINTQPNPPAR